MSVHIRSGRSDDAASLLDLWRSSTVRSSTDDEAAILALVAHDPDALLVAEHDGRVVGTLVAGFDGWRGQMYRLAAQPDHRRDGIARRLVEHAETSLAQCGARRISALVLADPVARAFWAAVGYEEDELDRRFVKNVGA